MSEKPVYPERGRDQQALGEPFLARFHRLKTEARRTEAESEPSARPLSGTDLHAPVSAAPEAAEPELSDADMPPIESLDAESDYSGFLSPGVSDTLRQAALRKLFHGTAFNVIDELDDYAEDFTTFEALGDIVTADMKHQIQIEAEKQAEALEKELLADAEQTEAGAAEVDAADSPITDAGLDESAQSAPDPDPDSEITHA